MYAIAGYFYHLYNRRLQLLIHRLLFMRNHIFNNQVHRGHYEQCQDHRTAQTANNYPNFKSTKIWKEPTARKSKAPCNTMNRVWLLIPSNVNKNSPTKPLITIAMIQFNLTSLFTGTLFFTRKDNILINVCGIAAP